MFRILDRYFILSYQKLLWRTVLLLALVLVWPMLAGQAKSQFWLGLTLVPYTAYLVLPLAAAVALLQLIHKFKSSGEWEGLLLSGWRPWQNISIIFILTAASLVLLQLVSQSGYLQQAQTQLLQTSDVIIAGPRLIVQQADAQLIIEAKAKQLLVTRHDQNQGLQQTIYQAGAKQPSFSLSVAKTAPPKLKSIKLIFYQTKAMALLLMLLLAFVILVPLQNCRWPLFFGIITSLGLYLINIELMHWLQHLYLGGSEILVPMIFGLILLIIVMLKGWRQNWGRL